MGGENLGVLYSNKNQPGWTDSSIAPSQNQRFSSSNVSRLLDTRKDAPTLTLHLDYDIFIHFLVREGLSNDDVRDGKGHRISGHSGLEELVSKPTISLEKRCGDYRRTIPCEMISG